MIIHIRWWQRGAKISTRNHVGETPLKYLSKEDQDRLIQLDGETYG